MQSQPPRESRYTVSTGMTWLLLGVLRTRGLDVAALVKSVDLELTELIGPDARMPLWQLQRLWSAAVLAAGDEALGVTLASGIDPRSTFSWPAPFSLHEHIARASATLRDGLTRQTRFLRLLRDGVSVEIEGTSPRPLGRFEFAMRDEPRSLIDFQLASTLLLARRAADDPTLAPVEVRFAYEAPADPAPYERFFGTQVRFGADHHGIVSDGVRLDQPLPTSNPMMLEVLERRAQKALDALPALDDLVALVRERIEAELRGGNTNASWVAEQLGMSTRTLHRKLQAEGASYQDLLDQTRCRLATRYLASRKHTINEVAQLVGFAQPSAFHRAFKAWTGATPSDYQARFPRAPS